MSTHPARKLAPVSREYGEPILPDSDVMRWIEVTTEAANDLWSNSCLIDQVEYKPLATKDEVADHLISLFADGPHNRKEVADSLRLLWKQDAEKIKREVHYYLTVLLYRRAEEAGVELYEETTVDAARPSDPGGPIGRPADALRPDPARDPRGPGRDRPDGPADADRPLSDRGTTQARARASGSPNAPQEHPTGEPSMSTATTPFRSTATSSEGGDFERPPSGMHPAVLVGLIDLGTHTRTYGGKTWDARKILFAWELTAEKDKDGNNFIVAQDYTWSLNKKANLRSVIEGWIGRGLRDDEEYDFGQLLGQACIVNLTEGLTAGGKKFTEIASASPVMRGMTVPPKTVTLYAFCLAEEKSSLDDPPIPSWVPLMYGRKVVDEIKASHEWAALPNV